MTDKQRFAKLAKQKFGSPDDLIFIFKQLLKKMSEEEKTEIRSQLDAKYKEQEK